MRWLDFSDGLGAFVLGFADEQRLASFGLTGWNSVGWNIGTGSVNPCAVTDQNFKFVLSVFTAAPSDIADTVRWNDFS